MGGFLGMAGFQPEEVVRPDLQYGALDRVVSPGYFETMRIRLRRGRLFDDHDGPDAPAVAIINETMAQKSWPNEDALSKRFRFKLVGGSFRLFQIVGIVDDVKEMGLASPERRDVFPVLAGAGELHGASTLVVHTKVTRQTLPAPCARPCGPLTPTSRCPKLSIWMAFLIVR